MVVHSNFNALYSVKESSTDSQISVVALVESFFYQYYNTLIHIVVVF